MEPVQEQTPKKEISDKAYSLTDIVLFHLPYFGQKHAMKLEKEDGGTPSDIRSACIRNIFYQTILYFQILQMKYFPNSKLVPFLPL